MARINPFGSPKPTKGKDKPKTEASAAGSTSSGQPASNPKKRRK